jgi:hypothetical protein
MAIQIGTSEPSAIKYGDETVSAIYIGRTQVYSSEDPVGNPTSVSWGGDSGYERVQLDPITKDNAGTAGRINLIERVYDQTSTRQFCVTADCVDLDGIAEVRVYYGGPTSYVATERTKVGGRQGYWFQFAADSNPASVETRKVYAEIVPTNPALISRVVSKTIRVGSATVSDLAPTNDLHLSIANNVATDNSILELSTGIYWLRPYNPGVGTTDKWVELRAKAGHHPIIKIVPAVPTTSSYQRGQSDRSYFQCRASHLVIDGCTIETWYASFEVRGSSGFSGSCYFGADNCTFQDEYNAVVGPICGFPRSNAITGSLVFYFENVPFRNGLNTRYDLHNSSIFWFDAAGAHDYFNCDCSVGRDIIQLNQSSYFDPESPGICINGLTNKSYFRDGSSDLKTVRLYDNISGTRLGFYDKSNRYCYNYDDLFDAAQMVYQVESIDHTNPENYIITLAEGERFTQNSLPDWAAYEWAIWRWPAGVDLTIENREFIGDPPGAAGGSYLLQWVTTNRTVITYRDSRGTGFNVQSLGINPGDRIAVVRWNHQDACQFAAVSGDNVFENIVCHDYVSVLEQQPIFENCQSSSGVSEVLDVIWNNCIWLTPSDLNGNPSDDLGTTSSQFYVTPLRCAIKFSTHPDHPFQLREDTASLDQTEFNFELSSSIMAQVQGIFGHDDETWDLKISDCLYSALQSINLVTTPTSSSQYSTASLTKWGVPSGAFTKSSIIQSLPYHVDGTAHTGQIGALPVDVEWEPTIGAYFYQFPKASHFNPTSGTSVSVTDGILDFDHSGSVTYQWRLNDVDIAGATSSAYTVQASDIGSHLSCLVQHSTAKTILYFGIVQ